MNIAAMIGIVIGLVVGIALLAPVQESVDKVSTANGYSSSISSLVSILPIIFITVIIIGAVGFFAFSNSDKVKKEKI